MTSPGRSSPYQSLKFKLPLMEGVSRDSQAPARRIAPRKEVGDVVVFEEAAFQAYRCLSVHVHPENI
eukprot:CAMPEP_0180303748 /NCGR_PEP_ID=MMETSP0988-20121125/25276_1 /TAXON_ID=697907 /ORGANISM="non described non described, Strain CCMP2293" /LENGTH=66 /DNA_ID=CAMNT_0022285571 /DNA_START=395 /DNA_END=595 /DNA_ORIENTATION=+